MTARAFTCWICGKSVDLRSCKTDEYGSAVHEPCYVTRTILKSSQRGRKLKSPAAELQACTDEELEQKLARVLAYASGETLNDSEMQEFHQLCEEIQRRALAVTAA